MGSHHRRVALDTHSRLVAAATGFGGKKDKVYDPFIDRLLEAATTDAPEKRVVSLSEIIALGRQVEQEQAQEGEEAQAERQAQEAAMLAMFNRNRPT